MYPPGSATIWIVAFVTSTVDVEEIWLLAVGAISMFKMPGKVSGALYCMVPIEFPGDKVPDTVVGALIVPVPFRMAPELTVT